MRAMEIVRRAGMFIGGIFIGRKTNARENHAEERKPEAGGAEKVEAFATDQRKRYGERGPRGRNRRNDTKHADFKGMVKSERGYGVNQAGDQRVNPGPESPQRHASKNAGGGEVWRKRRQTDHLHEQQRGICAQAARGESRDKIGNAPAESRGDTEDNFQNISSRKMRVRDAPEARGQRRFGFSPRTAITFCKSFQTSPFAFGLRKRYAGW